MNLECYEPSKLVILDAGYGGVGKVVFLGNKIHVVAGLKGAHALLLVEREINKMSIIISSSSSSSTSSREEVREVQLRKKSLWGFG